MKNKYRILKIIFTIGILIFLLNFSLQKFNQKTLENIEIKMLQKEKVGFVNEKEIREMVRKSNPSQKLGEMDIPALERKISNLPAVDSVNIYLKLNGELNLDIVQRIPIFRLEKKGHFFYVDEKGEEFPLSKNYSHPCMLVSGNVKSEEYLQIIDLVKKIEADKFSKNFFIGLKKIGEVYFLMTNEGDYIVELGDLDNLDFKIKGFKIFMEKYLIHQPTKKYSKISLRYENQIVTTLRKGIQLEEEKK